jgi:transaldolase
MRDLHLIREIVNIFKNYNFLTHVVAASLRSPMHMIEPAKTGANIGTMPFKVLDMLFNHPRSSSVFEDSSKVVQKNCGSESIR